MVLNPSNSSNLERLALKGLTKYYMTVLTVAGNDVIVIAKHVEFVIRVTFSQLLIQVIRESPAVVGTHQHQVVLQI